MTTPEWYEQQFKAKIHDLATAHLAVRCPDLPPDSPTYQALYTELCDGLRLVKTLVEIQAVDDPRDFNDPV